MKIRSLMAQKDPQYAERTDGVYELDECYIGGVVRRRKGYFNKDGWKQHEDKKTPVFGILKRGGAVFAKVVSDTQRLTLSKYIFRMIKAGSEVNTDEASVYSDLGNRYVHRTVNHTKKEFVYKTCYTNSLENFWRSVKDCYRVHRYISRKHLQAYVDYCVFLYNHRNDRVPIFLTLLGRACQSPYLKD